MVSQEKKYTKIMFKQEGETSSSLIISCSFAAHKFVKIRVTNSDNQLYFRLPILGYTFYFRLLTLRYTFYFWLLVFSFHFIFRLPFFKYTLLTELFQNSDLFYLILNHYESVRGRHRHTNIPFLEATSL